MPSPAATSPLQTDSARLAAVLSATHAFIWRCVRRFGVAESQVDDVVQEAFMILNRRLTEVEPGKERAFLTSTAFHLASNWRRTAGRAPRLVELEEASDEPLEQPSAEELLDRKRARLLLDKALDQLPSKLRGPFVLAEVEGLTRDEISDLLSIPPGTVATRVRLGRQKFQACVRRMTLASPTSRGES